MFRISIKTDRLVLQPFSNRYLEDYYHAFTEEIVKYQYPDQFSDMKTAEKVMNGFMEAMKKGEMIELTVLTQNGEFLGGVEVFDLQGNTPEIGIWLKEKAHGNGYGYEAVKVLIEYLNTTKEYLYYIYAVDIRNKASIRLVEKFHYEKGGYKELETLSGKKLKLQEYRIFYE